MRPRAVSVKPIDNYQLEVVFSNRDRGIFDVKPYMRFPAFKDLAACFDTVHVAGLSVTWSNGADICPDELYYGCKLINDRPISEKESPRT